jgi:transposase-like protein
MGRADLRLTRVRCVLWRSSCHKTVAKLPRLMQAKMKGLVRQIFLAPTYAAAIKRGRDLIAKFKDRYSAAMECLEQDLEECVTHLRFPEAHHRRIRTTNRLERLNGESRRRTKVIPQFPTERSCLSFVICELDHRVEALARDSHDRIARQRAPAAERSDRGPDEGGSGCVM